MAEIFPAFESFKNGFAESRGKLVYAKISSDLFTPVSLMAKLQDKYDYCFLFESVHGGETRGRYSIIGLGSRLIWKCEGNTAELDGKKVDEPALVSLKKLVRETVLEIPQELPPMSTGLFGYLGYDTVRLFEKIPDSNKDELGVPDGVLFVPEALLIIDTIQDELSIVTPVYNNGKTKAEAAYKAARKLVERLLVAIGDKNPAAKTGLSGCNKKVEFESNCTREEYHGMVEKAKEYIRAGDVFQLVPSQRFSAKFPLPPFAFYRSLRHLNPSPFLFFIKLRNFHIVGSSPEILVRLREGKVTVRPIAGTRKRGKNEAEDKALAADLLSDQKELAEHLMLLDLGRNDVGRVAKTSSVRVTERMVIEYYSHVMHIVSNVEGQIAEGKDVIDALAAGFPAGTVSGAPKIRAMEIIDEIEKVKRKFYAGAIGYFAGEQMDSCIGLRTALIKEGKIYLQAGGGVVADSDPEAEYQETLSKARALMKAAEEAGQYC